MYDRQKYIDEVQTTLEPNIFKHSLAVEACMGGIYDYLNSQGMLKNDELPREDWLMAGLLHYIDYAGEFKKDHPNKTKEALEEKGLSIPDGVMKTIKAHAPELTGIQPASQGEWAIFCMDSLTGLIVAVALVYPTKKLADVKLSSVIKRFLKEPKFAAGTRRDEVAMCSKQEGLNIPLEKFIEICLESMKMISAEIGL